MPTLRIEGCAIVSADGMLTSVSGVMPDALKFEGDQRFFNDLLDTASLIVHGRNSFEDQKNSSRRLRLILSRKVVGLARDPTNPKATLWNPQGASFEEACADAGVDQGLVAIIGGTSPFGMFLDRYDTFWLSEAHKVRLPNGVPVFPEVPQKTPRAVLARHGMVAGASQMLDADHGVTLTAWTRKT